MTRLVRAAVAAVLLAAGCGGPPEFPPLFPVDGTVAYAGGKPLTHGFVEFECEADPQLRATAGVLEDGRIDTVYTVKSNGKTAAGLAAGAHKVCVCPDPTATGRTGPVTPIPAKYTSFATTDLRVTVDPAGTRFTLTLDAGKK